MLLQRFILRLTLKSSFEFRQNDEETFKKVDFGERFTTDAGDLILVPKESLLRYKGKNVKINILPLHIISDFYRKIVDISPADIEYSNIINLTLEDAVEERAIDILNSLMDINNENALKDKKAIADRTSKFINDRITDIYNNLSDVDETEENYKAKRGIAKPGFTSQRNFQPEAAGQEELQNASIQLNIAESMQNLIADQNDYSFIPVNIGISDSGIANSAQRFNELIAERNRLLESSNEKPCYFKIKPTD